MKCKILEESDIEEIIIYYEGRIFLQLAHEEDGSEHNKNVLIFMQKKKKKKLRYYNICIIFISYLYLFECERFHSTPK